MLCVFYNNARHLGRHTKKRLIRYVTMLGARTKNERTKEEKEILTIHMQRKCQICTIKK